MWPELRVMVHGVGDNPGERALGGELMAIMIHKDAGLALASAAGWRPEAECLFYQSCGVREAVEDVRIILDHLSRVGAVVSEDLVALGAEFEKTGRVS